jgi:purine-nucleoside phosphorylase
MLKYIYGQKGRFMYKAFEAKDYKKFLGFSKDYFVDGFLVFGTYEDYPYQMLKDSLNRLGLAAKFKNLEHDFLKDILEFQVNDKNYWFVTAYGGATLSEYLHLACLFGSKINMLLGSCGGLKSGAKNQDIIVPTWSYAEESSAKAYQPDSKNKYLSDEELSNRVTKRLERNFQAHRGPTITYQAMMAETWEDIQKWSKEGFIGVEMEAATVFSVSNHFGIPSAAILKIADNLIEEETVFDINYEKGKESRHKIIENSFDVALTEIVQE